MYLLLGSSIFPTFCKIVPIFDVIFIFFTNLLKINFTFNRNLNLIFAKY